MENELKGLVFDIQGYSVHDGPGCRSLVFLSGCPLRCRWCSNPESWEQRQRVMYKVTKCVSRTRACRRCGKACPHGAISFQEGALVMDRNSCKACQTRECIDACLHEGLTLSGKYMTVDDLMRVLKRDQQYWRGSGGVTFSGGEPLGQGEFIREALRRCREAYIHTAVETTACIPAEHFFDVLRFVDWAFIDLKHMDPDKHQSYTGVKNHLILKNIAVLAGSDWPGMMMIRIPIIEGFNDDEENISASADYLVENGLEEVNILPFHRLGESKWQQLGMEYPYKDLEAPTQEKMDRLADIFKAKGVACYQGSLTPF